MNNSKNRKKKIKMAKNKYRRTAAWHGTSRIAYATTNKPIQKACGSANAATSLIWRGRSANEIYWIVLEFCSEIVVWDSAVFRLFICLCFGMSIARATEQLPSHIHTESATDHIALSINTNGGICSGKQKLKCSIEPYVYWILCDAMATTTIATSTTTQI